MQGVPLFFNPCGSICGQHVKHRANARGFSGAGEERAEHHPAHQGGQDRAHQLR